MYGSCGVAAAVLACAMLIFTWLRLVEEKFNGRDTEHAREAIASENEWGCGREGSEIDDGEKAACELAQTSG